jgi:acetoacetate decarboxylase
MELTIDLPENLAISLQSNRKNIPEILEFGLREFKASSSIGYKNVADVMEFLANLPKPEEILAMKPSKDLQDKIGELLEKNRQEGLTEKEEQIWASYEFIEHLIRIAKAKALSKLKK